MSNYVGTSDTPLTVNKDTLEVTIDVDTEDLTFVKLDDVTNVDNMTVEYYPEGSDTPVTLSPSPV